MVGQSMGGKLEGGDFVFDGEARETREDLVAGFLLVVQKSAVSPAPNLLRPGSGVWNTNYSRCYAPTVNSTTIITLPLPTTTIIYN